MSKKELTPWYKQWWFFIVIIVLIGAYMSSLNDSVSKQEHEKENQVVQVEPKDYASDVEIEGFQKYEAKEDGFTILFPAEPEILKLEVGDSRIKSYQAHALFDDDSFAQYNVFVDNLKNGKILEDEPIDVYLDNYANGRAAQDNGTLVTENRITFYGFDAVEYEFVDQMYEMDMVHKGVVFIMDGDPMGIGVISPKGTSEAMVHYEDFKKSFALGPIDTPLNDQAWNNGDVSFNPPAGWTERDYGSEGGRLTTFGNEAGHSIELFDADASGPVSCTDIKSEFGSSDFDEYGNMIREFQNPDFNDVIMKMIILCAEGNGNTFMIVGKAPKDTYFRSELIFKGVLQSFSIK